MESDVARAADALVMDRPGEAVAMLEPHLARNPKDASAHMSLGWAFRQQAFELRLKNLSSGTDVSAERTTLLTKSAAEYRTFFELVKDQTAADFHNRLALTLGAQGRRDAAVEVFRRAKPSLPASQQRNLGVGMWSYVKLTRNVPTPTIKALVDEMSAIADRWLADQPDQATGPVVKHLALELQAEFLEPDAARKQQVMADARQWNDVAEKHLRGETAEVLALVQELKKRQAAKGTSATR